MKAAKFILMTLVILISGRLHANSDKDCNNVLAFQPRKGPIKLKPDVKPDGLQESTAQIVNLIDRLKLNSPPPVIEDNTLTLATERLEDLSQAASALVMGVRALISHGPSTAPEKTRVLKLSEHRLLVTLVPLLMRLDQHILKYEMLLKHPDLVRLTEDHPKLLRMVREIEQNYALFQAIAMDTRMIYIAPELNASQLSRTYRDGSFTSAEINEEFELPFFKRTSDKYIQEGVAVLLEESKVLFDSMEQLGELVESPHLSTLNAQPTTHSSFLSAMDLLAAVLKRHASNLDIFSKEVSANTPQSKKDIRRLIRSFQSNLLTILKSEKLKSIRDKEFVIDRSLVRKFFKKSRFADVPALTKKLEAEVSTSTR